MKIEKSKKVHLHYSEEVEVVEKITNLIEQELRDREVARGRSQTEVEAQAMCIGCVMRLLMGVTMNLAKKNALPLEILGPVVGGTLMEAGKAAVHLSTEEVVQSYEEAAAQSRVERAEDEEIEA